MKTKETKTKSPMEAGAIMIIEEMGNPETFISFLLDAIEWTHSYFMSVDLTDDNTKSNDPHYELGHFLLEGVAIAWLKASLKNSSNRQDSIKVVAEGLKELHSNVGDIYQEKILGIILPAFAKEFKDSTLNYDYLEECRRGINCLFKIDRYLEEYEAIRKEN